MYEKKLLIEKHRLSHYITISNRDIQKPMNFNRTERLFVKKIIGNEETKGILTAFFFRFKQNPAKKTQ